MVPNQNQPLFLLLLQVLELLLGEMLPWVPEGPLLGYQGLLVLRQIKAPLVGNEAVAGVEEEIGQVEEEVVVAEVAEVVVVVPVAGLRIAVQVERVVLKGELLRQVDLKWSFLLFYIKGQSHFLPVMVLQEGLEGDSGMECFL